MTGITAREEGVTGADPKARAQGEVILLELLARLCFLVPSLLGNAAVRTHHHMHASGDHTSGDKQVDTRCTHALAMGTDSTDRRERERERERETHP